MSDDLMRTIENLGVVPVVVINNADRAVGLAKALLDGGIPCIEVTFRTAAAEQSIRLIHERYPQMLIGAGTVLTIEQARRALDAGALFIVSPGYDPQIVDWCLERNIPVFPGVCTASEVQAAVAKGLKVLKFFPAEASGGVGMIKNLCGPFPGIRFMTTGGISMANLAEYAACPNVLAVGGSWMVKSDMIESESWDTITALCRQAVCCIHGFEMIHFGINTDSQEKAQVAASLFEAFGMQRKVGSSSTFMDTSIEIMHKQFYGRCGHIGFKCNDVERALSYLGGFGFTPNMDTVKLNEKGRIKVVYLNEEVEGFAIHLVRR